MKNKPLKEAVITIRIDRDLAEKFRQIAKKQERSQASLLRDYIRGYVRRTAKQQQQQVQVQV